MNAAVPSVDVLERHFRAVTAADKPSEMFKRVLDGARTVVPRSAVFLVVKERVKGWGCVGYDPAATERLRAYSAAAGEGWLAEVCAAEGATLQRRRGSGPEPDFGQSATAEAVALPIRVRGKTLAVLLAERTAGEEPWIPSFLAMMAKAAELRLELDLLRRRASAGPAAASPSKTPSDKPAASAPDAGAPPAQPARDPGEDREVAAAKRFARLVATDIRLYNEEAVMLGRRNGDLEERLGEHLARGKDTFLRRHGDLGDAGLRILHDAFVQVLAAGDRKLVSDAILE